MYVKSYKELDKEVLDLYVVFWKYREKMTIENNKINALSSIAVYSSVLEDYDTMNLAMQKIENLGYVSKKCFEMKEKDLEDREKNSEKYGFAFDFGDVYAVDLHEVGFKLDLTYTFDSDMSYDFVEWNIKSGNGYILFNDIEYDSEIGEQQWLKIPFSDEVEYWRAKKG